MLVRPVAQYGSKLYQVGGSIAQFLNGEIQLRHTGESPLVMREKMERLIELIEASPGKFSELPLDHQFANGMYIRRLFIPKGSLIYGAIHKDSCVNVVEQGDISVLTETGFKRVQAGYTVVSPPGIRKIGYAHADTVFTNIFRTDETDISKIADVLTWKTYQQMNDHIEKDLPCLCS